MNTLAVIDIGSNSVRMFVFDVAEGRPIQKAARKFFSGLGRDLGVTQRLNPEAVNATLRHLADFRREIDTLSGADVVVIGTAALREARDAPLFLQAAKEQSNFDIRIIDGDEEARLAALAILSGDAAAQGVVADFGGGSLELAGIADAAVGQTISLQLGAHYLSAAAQPSATIEQVLNSAGDALMPFLSPQRLYVIGGSWRSLAKVWAIENQPDAALEGLLIPASELMQFCDFIGGMAPELLVERYDMEKPRAALMGVSALMLRKLVEKLTPRHISVSTAGIRDGVVRDYILGKDRPQAARS